MLFYLLLAISLVLQLLVAQHAFDGLGVVSSSNLVNNLGDFHVLVTRSNHADSSFQSSVSSLNDISLDTSDRVLSGSTNNKSVSNNGTETIDLDTKLAEVEKTQYASINTHNTHENIPLYLHLGNIASLQSGSGLRVRRKRRKVGNAVVERDRGRETNTYIHTQQHVIRSSIQALNTTITTYPWRCCPWCRYPWWLQQWHHHQQRKYP